MLNRFWRHYVCINISSAITGSTHHPSPTPPPRVPRVSGARLPHMKASLLVLTLVVLSACAAPSTPTSTALPPERTSTGTPTHTPSHTPTSTSTVTARPTDTATPTATVIPPTPLPATPTGAPTPSPVPAIGPGKVIGTWVAQRAACISIHRLPAPGFLQSLCVLENPAAAARITESTDGLAIACLEEGQASVEFVFDGLPTGVDLLLFGGTRGIACPGSADAPGGGCRVIGLAPIVLQPGEVLSVGTLSFEESCALECQCDYAP
jgi:hypothetical protein